MFDFVHHLDIFSKINDYMDKHNFDQFINKLQCPICSNQILENHQYYLKCTFCFKEFKIHPNGIIKLFTPENIYPTKEKINWKNIYE